jgi:hypothetical protein
VRKDCSRVPIVVGIPVNNEAGRIANCLRGLCAQRGVSGQRLAIVLLLNNCTDDTSSIVRNLVPALSVSVHTFNITLPAELANAGYARRMVMTQAEEFVQDNGVLLTTDADASAPSSASGRVIRPVPPPNPSTLSGRYCFTIDV